VIECYQETLGFGIKKITYHVSDPPSIVKSCGKIYRHYKAVSGSTVTWKPSLALRGFSSIRFHIGRTIVEFVIAVLVFVFPLLEKEVVQTRGLQARSDLGALVVKARPRVNYLNLPKGILPL